MTNKIDEIEKEHEKFIEDQQRDLEYDRAKLLNLGYDEGFIEMYQTFSIDELEEFEKDLNKDDIGKVLSLIDFDPFVLFDRFTLNQKKEWFERIRSIDLKAILNNKEIKRDIKVKLIKWLNIFFAFYGIETKRNAELLHVSTADEQIYVLQLLEMEGVINWSKLSKNVKSKDSVLGILLNRGKAQAIKKLLTSPINGSELNKNQLEKIRRAFLSTNNKGILNHLNNIIENRN